LRASPAQRQELLSLAASQGILHARQLGDTINGSPVPSRRPLLSSLLSGQVQELDPLHPPAVSCHDTKLDPAQRDAVARAVSSPDVCLIQGAPGTGKSRVVAEVLAQAVGRGERVLLLAPSPAAIDRVLELLGPRESAFPIRCLSPGELLDSLPPCTRRLTMAERLRTFEQQTLPAARESLLAAQQQLEQRRHEEPLWGKLEEIAALHTSQAQREAELEKLLAGVDAEVAAEVSEQRPGSSRGPLQPQAAELSRAREEKQAQLDAQLAVLHAEAAKVHAEKARSAGEREDNYTLVEARTHWRVFSPAYWRAWLRGITPDRLEELNRRVEQLAEQEQRLGREVAELETERGRVEREFQDRLEQLRQGEAARRRADLQEQAAGVRRNREKLLEEWRSVCVGFGKGNTVPGDLRPQSVRAAREAWDGEFQKESKALDFAREWARSAEESLPHLAERLAGCANVVAATTTGLFRDAHFGDHGTTPLVFDLLVLEDAHEVTESDFLHAARRAARWVLVGLPAAGAETSPPSRKPRQGKAVPPPALRPGFFHRLWKTLHDDPRRLPLSWFQRDGRVVCRLQHVVESDKRSVQSEWVADRPDIELRILNTTSGPPELAEVVFPSTWSIQEAKEYVFRELDEVRIDPHGHTLRWGESGDAITFDFVDGGGRDLKEVSLGPGVREWVAPVRLSQNEVEAGRIPWVTSRIGFSPADGWTRERAWRWVEQHLHLRPLGRTALLTATHRMQPALGAVLSELLGERALEPPSAALSGQEVQPDSSFQFIAVPDSADHRGSRRRDEGDSRRRGGAATLAARSGSTKGAGLEADLAEPHHPGPLPAELRALLPHQGLVNYLEARALVQALQDLLVDPAFLSDAAEWHRHRAVHCACTPGAADHPQPPAASTHCPTAALIALYPAQVELIRRLMDDAGVRAPEKVRLEVGLPSDFHQRECLIALVSLTRSHTHRAVPFGEGPHQLVAALTRAASRLWVFGDPGTLARRCQWSGPLDHLDETAAERERDLLHRLCKLIPCQSARAGDFRPYEGSGV
jgi:hypothetical protein